jgi:hypothetical protein
MTREMLAADDWLDAAIAADVGNHRAEHIDDAGFTSRVMAVLPPVSALPAWRRRAIVALWSGAAVGVAFLLPGAFVDVAREAFRLIGGQAVSVSGVASAIVAGAALTWAATAYALRGD